MCPVALARIRRSSTRTDASVYILPFIFGPVRPWVHSEWTRQGTYYNPRKVKDVACHANVASKVVQICFAEQPLGRGHTIEQSSANGEAVATVGPRWRLLHDSG